MLFLPPRDGGYSQNHPFFSFSKQLITSVSNSSYSIVGDDTTTNDDIDNSMDDNTNRRRK